MDWDIGKSWEKWLVIQQQLVAYHIKDILIPFFRGGKYTEDDARTVMIQILNVVAFCHLQGDEDSQLKAIDFGLSDFVKPGWSSKVLIIVLETALQFSFNYNLIFVLSLAFNLTNLKSRGYPYEELGGQERSRTTQEQGNSKLDFWKLHCSFGKCIARNKVFYQHVLN
ncbi:unnamed protein product [Prunus armeniaca]